LLFSWTRVLLFKDSNHSKKIIFYLETYYWYCLHILLYLSIQYGWKHFDRAV